MKRSFLAAAVVAALAACSSHPSNDGPPRSGAGPESGNSTLDTPPPMVPLERPTRSY
ncbi:MAG TPA: hypothetical protein VJO12_00650 [Stellaceae bacterium]|nr:hypothetical protein [Stellaceae bacterium]